MKKKNLVLLVFLGLIITILSNCEKKDTMQNDNVTLLTNGSSKVWYLSKITSPSGTNITIPSCVLDDEICFNINGTRIRNNMSTIIDPNSQGIFSCIDTIEMIDTVYWNLNQNQDTLTVSYYSTYYDYNASSVSKIITLTNDRLVLNTCYNTSPYAASQQIETYYSD